jgi:hypothetical protein
VRGTRRTSSPVDGVADRGANAGRDGRTCGKREEGARRLLKPGGEEWGGPAVGVCDRTTSKMRGFVSQDHIGGFSMKRECTNTHK